MIRPFIKWAGSKKQLLNDIDRYLPKYYPDACYIEPFVGSGSVLFHLQPKHAIINDANTDLINAYKIIRKDPKAVLNALDKLYVSEEDYYHIRNEYNTNPNLSDFQRAIYLLYMNWAGFHGLYRVSKNGNYNVPIEASFKGKKFPWREKFYKKIDDILDTSVYLQNVIILNKSYIDLEKYNSYGKSFWYFDPPYAKTWNNYSNPNGQSLWDEPEQIRLKNMCDKITKAGNKFMLSNSNVPFIQDLYKDYNIHIVNTRRLIAAKGSNRNETSELLITNY